MEQTDKTRVERVKEHFARNKQLYLIGTACLLTGGLAGALATTKVISINDVANLKILSPTNIANVINIEAPFRKGHPGYLVKCLETGMVYPSQNEAAKAMGVSRASMTKHLNGERGSAGGMKFERLGEAPAKTS